MDPNALTLLHQLASNPQMVTQLQSVLSALGGGGVAPGLSAARSTHVPTSSSQEAFASNSSASSPAATLSTTGAVGPRRAQAPPPPPPQRSANSAETAHVYGGAKGNGGPSTPLQHGPMPTVSLQKYEQLERLLKESDAERRDGARAAAAAEQKSHEMEKEVQRLTQRVEQLSAIVAEQREQRKTQEDQHQLALEEVKHTFESVLRRKEEVHEESLRQLLKSRQLFAAAKKFEDTVSTRSGGRGLTDGSVAMNVRLNAKAEKATGMDDEEGGKVGAASEAWRHRSDSGATHRHSKVVSGSGVKRERSASLEGGGGEGEGASREWRTLQLRSEASTNAMIFTRGAATSPRALTTRMAATPGSSGSRAKTSATLRGSRVPVGVVAAAAAAAAGGNGGSHTAAKKRRTPRTPSLTHADRIASSRSPVPVPPPVPTGRPPAAPIAAPMSLSSAVGTSSRGRRPREAIAAEGDMFEGEGLVASTTLTPIVTRTRPPPPTMARERGADAVGAAPPRRAVSPHGGADQSHHYHHHPPHGSSTSNVDPAAAGGRGPGGAIPSSQQQPLPQRHQMVPHEKRTPHTNGSAVDAVPSTASGPSSAVGGPTRSPSPLNPKRGPMLPRRFIFTGLKDPEPERLTQAIEDIGEDAMVLAGDLDEPPPFSTTHIVVRGTPRSVKALCGVVAGKWLVPPEYVYNSQQAGFWLDEYEEGGLRLFPPPLKCQRFLLTMEHAGIKEKLTEVIEFGGGEVVNASAQRMGGDANGSVDGRADSAVRRQWKEQGVVVITSGDDLLRYATQAQA